MIIEALNATKLLGEGRRREGAERVVEAAVAVDLRDFTAAAESVGARHTAAPLIETLGGPAPTTPASAGYNRWVSRGARNSSLDLRDVLRRAPLAAPRVVWEQLTLSPDVARFWAHSHRVPYRSPRQILWAWIRRMMSRR